MVAATVVARGDQCAGRVQSRTRGAAQWQSTADGAGGGGAARADRRGHIHAIRWTPDCYRLEPFPLDAVNLTDPRQFSMALGSLRLLTLTSLSWLLPVELTPDGRKIVAVHYDRAIEPGASYQEYSVLRPNEEMNS
jgi:hypothetical protein